MIAALVRARTIAAEIRKNHFFYFKDVICTAYPCVNNGQCVPDENSRHCICTPPYQCDDCREDKRENRWEMDNVEREFASVIQVAQAHDVIYHEFSPSLILAMKVDVDA